MSMELLGRILVVAATERELAPSGGWRVLRCGVGPVDAAAATAAALARERPAAIVHVGIAGARRASGLMPPTLVIGDASIYCDLGVPAEWAPHRLTPDARLVDAAARALPEAARTTIGTSGRVGTTTGCDVEAMEGFAVLRAAMLAGVPAIEVRAIANTIEESDRSRWQSDAAFRAIVSATPALLREVAACMS
jgi:nucleoside phosphorylase